MGVTQKYELRVSFKIQFLSKNSYNSFSEFEAIFKTYRLAFLQNSIRQSKSDLSPGWNYRTDKQELFIDMQIRF